MEHLLAKGRVRNLRVKLDGINFLFRVFHRRYRTDTRIG